MICYLDFSWLESWGTTRRRCPFCSVGADSFFFCSFLTFCFSRTSATRSIRGQSWQSEAVAAVVGAKGICENGTEVSGFSGSELLCGAKESTRESTRVLCIARSIEGGMFVLRVYGDCSARKSRSGDLSGETGLETFRASRGTDKPVTFAGGDGLTVGSSRRGSGKLSGEKRCGWRPALPMIKFLMGTSAWPTWFDTT